MTNETYFFRNIDSELLAWSKTKDRRVLLLRGARQVGKSSTVRHLGKSFKYYVEINFEDAGEQVKALFRPGISPQEICMKLSAMIISVKHTPEHGEELRDKYADIVPGYYLNKAHWSSIFLSGIFPEAVYMVLPFNKF